MEKYLNCALLITILCFGAMLVAQTNPADASTNQNSTQSAPAPSDESPALGTRSAENNYGNTKVLPEGTQVAIRTNENIDSKSAQVGQTFSADVAEDVLGSNGQVVIPKRSPATLILRNVKAGSTTGTPDLALDLNTIRANGHTYHVSTADIQKSADKQGIGKNKRTGEYVGGGAALGTLLGAIAGGGKGAAIGAVAGAAAGGGAQVLTKGKDVKVPAETVLKFQLDQPLHLVE